jgi:PPIC-type PPIASE domain
MRERPMSQKIPPFLREPVIQFLLAGALLFAVEQAISTQNEEILVPRSLLAELSRRYEDDHGRPPSESELEQELSRWQKEEAMYREALRRGMEKDDAAVRSFLSNKLQTTVALQLQDPSPTDAELEAWLHAHEAKYRTPVTFEFEFLSFSPEEGASGGELERCEKALREGAAADGFGRPLVGSNLTVEAASERFGAQLGQALPRLDVGTWQRISAADRLFLVRVKAIEGGLPSVSEARNTLRADYLEDWRKRRVDEVLAPSLKHYHFVRQK